MRPLAKSETIPFAIAAVLIFIFAALTFFHLGQKPLKDFDEAIYAQVAHEAMQNGNQTCFTWLGNLPLHRPLQWFEKPPLLIWLTEISYAVFGVNEFAARFWPAIFAILTLPLAFCFAKKLSQNSSAAILAVAAFFTAFQFCDNARLLQMDIPVGFFVTLALFAFWRARDNSNFYLLLWIALALGLMIKSVIGLLPAPIIFIFSILARDFYFLKLKNFWLGLGIFFVLILPWHIFESAFYGQEFWHQYLFYHLLNRFSTALEGNSGSFWFYLAIFFRQQLFFWLLLASLIYFGVKSFKSKSHLFVTVAFLFIFLFFSAAGTKLPPYILVIYPLATLMIAVALADFAMLLNSFQKKITAPFAAPAVLIFLAIGIGNEQKILSQQNNPQLVSDKAVGNFLKTNCPDKPAFYFSVERVSPSIIFYADREIGYFADYRKSPPAGKFILISETPPPNFQNATVLFSAETEKVYQIP